MMRMRGIAAALVTVEVGLVLGDLVLFVSYWLFGTDPYFTPWTGYWAISLLLALAWAPLAGVAVVREAAEPDRGLVWLSALLAALWSVQQCLSNAIVPPGWYFVTLPTAVFVCVDAAGRWALQREQADQGVSESRGERIR